MNTTKMLISGIAGGIAAFFAGWLIYGIVLTDFMAQNTAPGATGIMRAEADMVWWAMIAGNLLYGLLFSYIFNRWGQVNTLSGGLTGGAIIGLLIGAAIDLTIHAQMNIFTLNAVWVDVAASAVLGAVTGAVVGWVNGMGKKA
ncbi:MAG TPA: hypothetical protein DHW64_12375 [Chitinophagaceae bacterium]|jgi:hypothetical protein|nr:hypothetical protein [Chitinophagaceae bacterium]